MTTIGLLITLLGAGSIAANVMRLIDHIDQPAPRHRRRAAFFNGSFHSFNIF